jgi:phosphoglycolate phosphatase
MWTNTLIENGGVSKDNYRLAFRMLTGRDPVMQPQTNGRTDVGIMEALLIANGVRSEEFSNGERLAALERAGSESAPALSLRSHALVGSVEVLRYLEARPEVIQSVLTGKR